LRAAYQGLDLHRKTDIANDEGIFITFKSTLPLFTPKGPASFEKCVCPQGFFHGMRLATHSRRLNARDLRIKAAA
jgi:hypothetical protein